MDISVIMIKYCRKLEFVNSTIEIDTRGTCRFIREFSAQTPVSDFFDTNGVFFNT